MSLRPIVCAAVSLAWVACAPELGDDCKTALDCSSQGSRLCDRTQPGGYCTLRGCEPGTCPEEAVCVKFRPTEERLAVTYCMRKCDDNGDCRNGEGYRCSSAEEFGVGGVEAQILGRESQRFCSVPMSPPDTSAEPMAGTGVSGGTPGVSDASAMPSDASDQ